MGDGWYVFLGHEDGSRPEPWPLADLRRPEDAAPDHLEVLEVDLPAHQQLVIEGEFDAGHFPLLHHRRFEVVASSFDGTRASARYLVHEPMAQEIEVELDGVSRMRLEVRWDDHRLVVAGDYVTRAADRVTATGSIALWGADPVPSLGSCAGSVAPRTRTSPGMRPSGVTGPTSHRSTRAPTTACWWPSAAGPGSSTAEPPRRRSEPLVDERLDGPGPRQAHDAGQPECAVHPGCDPVPGLRQVSAATRAPTTRATRARLPSVRPATSGPSKMTRTASKDCRSAARSSVVRTKR